MASPGAEPTAAPPRRAATTRPDSIRPLGILAMAPLGWQQAPTARLSSSGAVGAAATWAAETQAMRQQQQQQLGQQEQASPPAETALPAAAAAAALASARHAHIASGIGRGGRPGLGPRAWQRPWSRRRRGGCAWRRPWARRLPATADGDRYGRRSAVPAYGLGQGGAPLAHAATEPPQLEFVLVLATTTGAMEPPEPPPLESRREPSRGATTCENERMRSGGGPFAGRPRSTTPSPESTDLTRARPWLAVASVVVIFSFFISF